MREPTDALPRQQRAVQSAEVGGRLLVALSENTQPMTLKDLAAQAEMPPSRAHPYLVSYAKLGLIQQDDGSGRYRLGPAALRMGLTCLLQSDPLRTAASVAEALAVRTGQAVAIAVWGNFGATVVRMIEARQALHVAMRAGTVMSLFGTATGRAFAGALPRDQVVQGLGRSNDGVQPTKDLLATLDAEVESAKSELKAHGVTRAVGRPIPGVNAFSAPVRDHEGQVVLVITLLGHQDHFPATWSSPLASALRAAALAIASGMGHR